MTDENDRLPMWVIFDHPTNWPEWFVARKWYTLPQTESTDDMLKARTLDTLREMLPPGLVCISRQDNDAPHIVEVWL